MAEEDIQHFKIFFLGDQFVGKSSIINRFFQNKFEFNYNATIGLDFHSKNVNINNNIVRLLLYDIGGKEKYKSLIPLYIREANIIIIVYDISKKESFTHMEHWINETKDLKREDAILVLVGNKIDLEDKRAVKSKEAEDFANEKGSLFYEVSAKTGENVEDLFEKKIFPEMSNKYNIGNEEEKGEKILKMMKKMLKKAQIMRIKFFKRPMKKFLKKKKLSKIQEIILRQIIN